MPNILFKQPSLRCYCSFTESRSSQGLGDGKGYSALVMAEAWEGASMENVCSGICMTHRGSLANNERDGTSSKVAGTSSMCLGVFPCSGIAPVLPEKSAALLSELRSNFSNAAGKVSVPCHVNGEPVVLCVRKVTPLVTKRDNTFRRMHFFWPYDRLSFGRRLRRAAFAQRRRTRGQR